MKHIARSLPAMTALFTLSLLAGCDKVKSALRGGPDLQWQADSTFLATEHQVLFRVVPMGDTASRVIPIATIGDKGLHEVRLGNRGWRAFDLHYMQSNSRVVPIRNGRATGGFTVRRGMWEPSPFEPLPPNCNIPVPVALASAADRSVSLASNRDPLPLKYSAEISSAELQQALDQIPLLIAPTVGIGTSQLAKYERKVHTVVSGSGPSPTIVVIYDDPEIVADSIPRIGQRPRHFLVVLDKGIYGYKPSWTYKSLGNSRDVPRLRFLDYADVNGDGLAELFFTRKNVPEDRATIIMRFETDAWRESLRTNPSPCR